MWGQHFLNDLSIIEKEVEIAEISKKDRVLEIGAGNGILTEEIAKRAGEVVSFEIDLELKKSLESLVEKYDNLTVFFKDVTKENWKGYTKIVSNIPYHLSEHILFKSAESSIPLLVLIIGEKMKEALEGKSKMGFIVNLFYEIKPIEKVTSQKFFPKPRTNSWLVKLQWKDASPREKFIRSIFLREGKLKNSLIKSFLDIGVTKRKAKEMVKKLSLNEQVLNKPAKKGTYKLLKKIDQGILKLEIF